MVDTAASSGNSRTSIPDVTVSRLPHYLHALASLSDQGQERVSSEDLAIAVGVGSAKLRKDLSYLGSYGTRGVGYDVNQLMNEISAVLGLDEDWRVVIVGIGNLGHALAHYSGFQSRGFSIVGLVDADPEVIGREIDGMQVQSTEALESLVQDQRVQIGVVATPEHAAQEMCDRLVEAGVGSILNFAPCVLNVPPGVMVRRVDLSTELQILAFHQQTSGLSPSASPGTVA